MQQAALTPRSVERGRRGDRYIVRDIEEDEFQEKAKALREAAAARGLAIGSVYHRPLKTGMIFIK
jgi:hypothetical protein